MPDDTKINIINNLSPTILSISCNCNPLFHSFIPKNQFKPKPCLVCSRQIKFGLEVVKCLNCDSVCHSKCVVELSKDLCYGKMHPDQQIILNQKTLGKFSYPKRYPFIPFPILCLIHEIELNIEPGVYCLPTHSDHDVLAIRNILSKFHQRKSQHLRKYNVHILTNCLKLVLKELQDGPLVRHWNLIRNNSNAVTEYKLNVEALPVPNKNTLALLMIHLQWVSSNTESRMSLKSLAQIFAKILIEKENYVSTGFGNVRKCYDAEKLAENLILDLLQKDSSYYRRIIGIAFDRELKKAQ